MPGALAFLSLGTIGEIAIIVAFVACLVGGVTFFLAAQREHEAFQWAPIGRWSWGVMTVAALVASGILMYLLITHQYQYSYVYQNTSNDLPFRYLFSAFWAGQEGSFLLWILMNCGVGFALIKLADRDYEAPVMSVVAFCQAFMFSMIVGLQFGPLAVGASPFTLLAEAFPGAPIFQQNPGFVPADGTGLNDLLQNPWMTIHPPMLFAGFASMIVPFAFAVSALWKKRYTQWVRPALPWTLFGVACLGIGIALGGYWAYITLNFGGYWAWDPVENSSLVPWLVGIAALHTMLVQKKSGSSHKASLLLSILAFMLVIYSTFLTRSGVLGEISVHSFVDLGLYNQLLIWILTMGIVGFGLFAYRYRELPNPDREPPFLSREFMIFSGAMLLCILAAVVILGTSAPIVGQLFRESPSAVSIEFYNKWALPISLGLVFLAGLGQLFWWNKMRIEDLNRVLIRPLGYSVAVTVLVLLFTPFIELTINMSALESTAAMTEAGLFSGLSLFWEMYGFSLLLLMLLFGAFFAFFGNGFVLWRIGRGNPRMAGGAIAHIGFALMIIGILTSSGFDNPLVVEGQRSVRPQDTDRENFIIAKGQTRMIEGYEVTYEKQGTTERDRGQYHLNFTDPAGRSFTLKPVAYEGAGGQWFMHPDLKKFLEKDLFVTVTPREATGVDANQNGGEFTLTRGASTTLGDEKYGVRFLNYDTQVDADLIPDDAQIAVAATIQVTNRDTDETRTLKPVYIVTEDRREQYLQTPMDDWGLTFTFTGMDVNTGEADFTVEGADVMPRDWVVVQAYEKPLISILWVGFIVLTGGFVLAIVRRARDVQFSQRRKAKGKQ